MLESEKNLLGTYGSWAAGLIGEAPGTLSFRNNTWQDVEQWRAAGRGKLLELMAQPDAGSTPAATVTKQFIYDGLHVEELSWQLPFGPITKATFLKPQDATGPLPGIVALHDHSGNKYFGRRKIIKTSDTPHPLMTELQELSYGGTAWANEIAKQGYAVLVPDVFPFGSRRILQEDLPRKVGNSMAGVWDEPGHEPLAGSVDMTIENADEIKKYNDFAATHGHAVAKSLLCSGTTWPGVFSVEDQRSLDYLCSRDDVDADRIGCGGLSGGGLRSVFLAGLDNRIKCSVTVGFMTTLRELTLQKSYTHTWMAYVPLMAKYMDFPDVLSLRAPLPSLVLSTRQDDLYTMPEMERAKSMLTEIYAKANAQDRFRFSFYDGHHKFDVPMQAEAFDWFDKWLK